MTARLLLPTRLQLQTLDGLRQAIVGGANAVSNDVVNINSALAFINAFEDDFLAPIRLIWMRFTDDNIILDQYGTFDLRTLSYPVLEVVSVYAKSALTTAQNAFWQFDQPFDRKDLTTFRKLQGVLNNNPIYTVDGPQVRVWPRQNWYGPLSISYYADWPRLGDVSTASKLQQQTIVLSGVASAAGNIVITSGTATTTVPIASGVTSQDAINALVNAKIVYAVDSGGNPSYWTPSLTAPNTLVLTAPSYTNVAVATNLTTPAGLSFTNTTSQNPSVAYVQNNWFLDNYPYLYYYGALKHVFLYLNDLERTKWANDQVEKMTFELQALSDRADASDVSDGFNFNREVQW